MHGSQSVKSVKFSPSKVSHYNIMVLSGCSHSLYRSWVISVGDSLPSPSKSVRPPSLSRKDPLQRTEDEQCYDDAAGLLPDQGNVEELYAKVQTTKQEKGPQCVQSHRRRR